MKKYKVIEKSTGRENIMDDVYYETGFETPEILGSGSNFSHVVITADEEEAFKAYRSGFRNYLYKITHPIGKPRLIEWWDDEQSCWRRPYYYD